MTTMHSRQQLQMLASLKAQREDGLRMLRVTRDQAMILKDPCSEILLAGSNRGGKTILAAARFASIFRDVPIMTMDGEEVHCRLPHQQGRELLMWVIGDHLKHIGQTIYRVLFKRGLYKIVRDPKTGWWRSWNPVQFPSDRDIPRKDQHPSFPLIPGFDLENNIDPASEIQANGAQIPYKLIPRFFEGEVEAPLPSFACSGNKMPSNTCFAGPGRAGNENTGSLKVPHSGEHLVQLCNSRRNAGIRGGMVQSGRSNRNHRNPIFVDQKGKLVRAMRRTAVFHDS